MATAVSKKVVWQVRPQDTNSKRLVLYDPIQRIEHHIDLEQTIEDDSVIVDQIVEEDYIDQDIIVEETMEESQIEFIKEEEEESAAEELLILPSENASQNSNSRTCEMCGEKFLNRRNLKYHMKSHDGSNKPRNRKTNFACSCGRNFTQKALYAKHLKDRDRRKLSCRMCQACGYKPLCVAKVIIHLNSFPDHRKIHLKKTKKFNEI